MKGQLIAVIEKQKNVLKKDRIIDESDGGSIISTVWNYVIVGMMALFVLSIVNSLANNY